jgi:creatinine amidohydrolase/Fe(II)-dependent formamide hydrolase-like protein
MIEFWQDLTTTEFEGLDPMSTLALLPVAAIEQHGPHLPLSTDLIINRGIVHEAITRLAPGVRVLVLPEQAIGDSVEHTAFPGTLSLQPELLLALWADIGRGVTRTGLRKLVILNSHGGQVGFVDQAALRLRAEEHMLVIRANYFTFGTCAWRNPNYHLNTETKSDLSQETTSPLYPAMKVLLLMLAHLLTTLAQLLGPGGAKAIVADSLLKMLSGACLKSTTARDPIPVTVLPG